jgi:LysM repeat protein
VSVATAAATGAGIALPLFGATVAQAADNGTWDKVAVCETGGLWSANTGDGFYGGLAITQETWEQYGGDAFAARPDLASRSEQIDVAQRILADLGPNAWPGCEDGTGLLKLSAPRGGHDGTPPVGPVIPGLPLPSGGPVIPGGPTASPTVPASPADPGAPVTGVPGVTSTPVTPSPTADPAGTTAPVTSAPGTGTPGPGQPGEATAAPGGGRHGRPYSPTDEELAAKDRATRTEVFSTTDTHPATGVPVADGTTTDGNANSGDNSGASGSGVYTVGSGDSLSGIARAHHVDGGWHALYDANHHLIGDDPNLIKPGQIINLG